MISMKSLIFPLALLENWKMCSVSIFAKHDLFYTNKDLLTPFIIRIIRGHCLSCIQINQSCDSLPTIAEWCTSCSFRLFVLYLRRNYIQSYITIYQPWLKCDRNWFAYYEKPSKGGVFLIVNRFKSNGN